MERHLPGGAGAALGNLLLGPLPGPGAAGAGRRPRAQLPSSRYEIMWERDPALTKIIANA